MSETAVSLKRGPVSAGSHYARLTEMIQKTGPKGEYWEYTVVIEESSPDNGRELPLRISLTPQARWKMDEFLDAVEAQAEGEARGSSFLGKLIKVHVLETEYNDRHKAEIDAIFPAGIVDPLGGKLPAPEVGPLGGAPDEDIPF